MFDSKHGAQRFLLQAWLALTLVPPIFNQQAQESQKISIHTLQANMHTQISVETDSIACHPLLPTDRTLSSGLNSANTTLPQSM